MAQHWQESICEHTAGLPYGLSWGGGDAPLAGLSSLLGKAAGRRKSRENWPVGQIFDVKFQKRPKIGVPCSGLDALFPLGKLCD